ncbi:MAG: hypothetical protein LBT50_00760 [Prevotellaceae bacterium]|nr:hypothetical protein [Prevotellaceae bacterium]
MCKKILIGLLLLLTVLFSSCEKDWTLGVGEKSLPILEEDNLLLKSDATPFEVSTLNDGWDIVFIEVDGQRYGNTFYIKTDYRGMINTYHDTLSAAWIEVYKLVDYKLKIQPQPNTTGKERRLKIFLGSSSGDRYDGELEVIQPAGLDESDSDIKIRIIELLDESQRTLQFYCSTKQIYPSVNSIAYSFQQSSNNITVRFDSIIPGVLAAFGPATVVINLGTLSDGTYNLDISNREIESKGTLKVSTDSYEVQLANNWFTNAPMYRIPENTIWGTIGYHAIETLPLVETFIESLKKTGAKEHFYHSGNYGGEFDIDANGELVQPGKDSGYYFAKAFAFSYSGDHADLEQLVKKYAVEYGEDYLYISLYTDKGKKFLSWMY